MKQTYIIRRISRLINRKWLIVNRSDAGFTLIEMLFVVGIMAMVYLLISANFATFRSGQSLKNGQREVVTNIQKVRSFSLSGRRIDNNTAKFYVVRLDKATPTSYAIQGIAVDTASGLDVLYNAGPGNKPNIEMLPMPQTVRLSGLLLTQGSTTLEVTCVQLAFALPFGRTYIANCANNDIYSIYTVPSVLNTTANAQLVITLARSGTTDTRTITVYGVSGRIEAN